MKCPHWLPFHCYRNFLSRQGLHTQFTVKPLLCLVVPIHVTYITDAQSNADEGYQLQDVDELVIVGYHPELIQADGGLSEQGNATIVHEYIWYPANRDAEQCAVLEELELLHPMVESNELSSYASVWIDYVHTSRA